MRNHNFIDLLHASIQSSIQDQDIQQALQTIQTFKAADIADLLTQLPIESSQILLVNLPARAYVFSYLKPDQQIKLAKVIPWATLAEIIGCYLVKRINFGAGTGLYSGFDDHGFNFFDRGYTSG